MNSCSVAIEAVAYLLPQQRVTSEEIESQIKDTVSRFGFPKGMLLALTGIYERRFWDAGTMPSDAATMAARKVIEESGVAVEEIGCLINTSVCRDYIEPSVACLVHGNLQLSPYCLNYDIANACLGFLDGMNTIMMMIESGRIKYGLLVCAESSREPVEATIRLLQDPRITKKSFLENFATLTLGSGAVAMLICHKDYTKSGHIINGTVSMADTRYNRLCVGQKLYGRSDPKALLDAGVALAKRAWAYTQTKLANWQDQFIQCYAPHQVSKPHMDAIIKALNITPEKVFLNFPYLGNIGPAALPITLSMAAEASRIHAGDHVALLGIGSGINCSAMSVTW